MLILVLFITAFTVVISGDYLGVSYYFDDNYFNTFSERQCVNSTQWDLVSYGHLDVIPPSERSLLIRSSRNSCTSSFPIVFLNGTLELTVYLRTISKYSGITVSVFDEHDEVLVSVRYQRLNRKFVPGWALVRIPIRKYATGYVQISGQSLYSELVIVGSLRYIPDNSTHIQNDEKTQAILNNQLKSIKTTNEFKEVNIPVQTSFLFNENGNGVIEISEDDIDGSGSGDGEPEISTEDPDENTEEPGPETDTEDTDEDTEESGPETDTEDPDENTEEPSPEEDTDSPNPEDNGFWNAFTITFVTVGAFLVVGLVGVGAYYIGVNRGVSQSPPEPEPLESVEAPRIIPRARSVFSFSESTPYDRYS